MSLKIPQTQNLFENKVIHVFLGRTSNGGITINLVAPEHTEISKIECILSSAPSIQSKDATFKDDIVRLYQFEFDDLFDGAVYSYHFMANGKRLELGLGLDEKDLYFTYWSKLDKNDSIINMSCNGGFFYDDEKTRWGMWDRLYSEISSKNISPKLLVLAGDQYYQDEIEKKWFRKINDSNRLEYKKDSLENALNHWVYPSYRKVLAQIPSVAMLDDHDLTDGANGDRDEFYVDNTNEFNEDWKSFVEVQKELFALLQASRNPTPVIEKKNQAFSFFLDLGNTALFALDLRTEKNSRKKTVQDEDSKKNLLNKLREISHKNVLIVVPVVPVRNSQHVEGGLLGAIASIPLIKYLIKIFPLKVRKPLEEALDSLKGFQDDITDALSSEPNKDFLFDLIEVILEGAKHGVNYSILSGDIHTAGSVELHIEGNGAKTVVPILVSSPIAYKPMPNLVEAFLKEQRVVSLSHRGVSVEAINHAFTSNRNFMNIFPEKLEQNSIEAVQLIQEGVSGFKTVVCKGWCKEFSKETDYEFIVEKSLDNQKQDTLL